MFCLPAGSCSPDNDDWKFFEDRCYYFSPDSMTWWNAEGHCKENGGYLVSIHDENTNNFIKGQVRWISNMYGKGGRMWYV